MKKVLLGMMFGGIVLLTSCGGPSACDCVDNAKKGADADMSVAKNCLDKYGNEMDGEKFMEELKECD